MELEQLQQEWQLLNNKIEELELENHELNQKVINNKLQNQFERLINSERRNFIGFLITIPLLFILTFFTGAFTIGSVIWINIIVILCALWQGYIFFILKKIHTQVLSFIQLSIELQRYELYTRIRFLIGIPLAVITLAGFYLFERNHIESGVMLDMFIAFIIGVCICIPFIIKRLRNISSCIETLHELIEEPQ